MEGAGLCLAPELDVFHSVESRSVKAEVLELGRVQCIPVLKMYRNDLTRRYLLDRSTVAADRGERCRITEATRIRSRGACASYAIPDYPADLLDL